LAQRPEQDGEDFVEIAAFTYLAEAELTREMLEAEGIEVMLRNGQFASALPHMTNAVGGIRLTVAPADVERGREILEAKGGEPADAREAEALEGGEPAEHPRDALARRAWRGAVLGLFFLPVLLHLYSAWLAIRYHAEAGPVSGGSGWRARAALVIDLAVLGGVAAYLLLR
jgi:hypothetical protein